MGTNYYHVQAASEVCPHCGRFDPGERRHIGKSSGGWCFSLHVIPEEGLDGLEAWERKWQTGVIEDEYGDTLTPDQMRKVVTDRAGRLEWDDQRRTDQYYRSEADFHSRNHSMRGPNLLLRAQIDRRCIAHGEGTWDCFVGEFS